MILTFLASRLGQSAVIVSALVLALLANNYSQRAKGAEKVIVAAKERGAKANEKNEAVRAAADRPGAAERVRQSFCRDCND